MLKRFIDIVIALTLLLLLWPLMLIIFIYIGLTSKGSAIFRQERIGKNMRPFVLYKFRTMYQTSGNTLKLTLGESDKRITPAGKILRAYKLDELPQLLNVLKGDMSMVGPRPEVPGYVEKYREELEKILSVRPGLTDFASLKYYNENSLLEKSDNPEFYYLGTILPDKLVLNRKYVDKSGIITDFKIMCKTIFKIFFN